MRILYNARIRTMDPAQPFASALALEGDYILAVGSNEDILACASPGADRQDMAGRTLWPGLTDAHMHLENYAYALSFVDCETATRQECLERVTQRVAQTPPGEWVRGHGWNQNVWPEGFGNAALLDALAPNHPVYLTAKSLHASWANSAALRKAGITAATPDPADGIIGRDEQGNPNGLLFENAMLLVEDAIPEPDAEQVSQAIAQAQPSLWQVGLTGVHDYDSGRCFAALQILHQRRALHLRVVKGIPLANLPHAVALGLRSGFGNDFIRTGSVKLFADGALGPRTAAMLQPYEGDESQYTGEAFLDAEQIVEYGQQAVQAGLSLAIHAIGDRANHEVLNAYSQLRQFESERGLPHPRHRIEHVQILHPDDYARLAQTGTIASMQPIHATSDMYIADRHWGKRSAGAYAWRTLLQQGTALAFGSDAPVESPNPFFGLHAAVTRRRPDGSPDPQGWYPEQRLTLEEALAAFTCGPAYAAGVEQRFGKLAAGYCPDLIVLPDDPFDLPAQELHNIRPLATMLAGEWVWQSA